LANAVDARRRRAANAWKRANIRCAAAAAVIRIVRSVLAIQDSPRVAVRIARIANANATLANLAGAASGDAVSAVRLVNVRVCTARSTAGKITRSVVANA